MTFKNCYNSNHSEQTSVASHNMDSEHASHNMDSEQQNGCSKELTAAAALTSLVGSSSNDVMVPAENAVEEDETEHDDDEDAEDSKRFSIPQKFTKSGRKRAVPFPLKLMKVLSSKEFSHIISWLPSGKSFVILKPKLFTLQILPGHFKSAKYSSFTRKLHRWGFMRHYRGEEAGAFFHEDFQRGCLDLVEKMTCFKHNEQPAKPSPTLSRSQPTNESIMNAAVISKAHVAATSRSMPAPQVHPISTALPLQFTNVLERLNVYHRNANSLESSLNGIRQAGRSSLDPVSAMNAFRSQSMDVRPDLNAVIEMEVHWRVKERMDAAAVNRLVLMQQQAKFSGYPPILRPQAPFPPSPFVPAWNQPGSSMSWNRAALALAAQNLYATSGGNKQPPISHSAFGNLQSLAASLPPTNIQGAKTA